MFQIVVFFVPNLHLLLQIGEAFEFVALIEFFLVFSVASLHCTVLGRFAGVDEIVDHVVPDAKLIQSMQIS